MKKNLQSTHRLRLPSRVTGGKFLLVAGILAGIFGPVRADVLTGDNGEKFVGQLVCETNGTVVFESELGGRLVFPRGRIREIQVTFPAPAAVQLASTAATNLPASAHTNEVSWMPPGVGRDGEDWIQFKSGEWIKGRFKFLQQKKVEFDSDQFDQVTLDFKDIAQIHPHGPMWVKFDDRQNPVFGDIVVSNGIVLVDGPELLSLPRSALLGITPPGISGFSKWSGKFGVGFNWQSGNTHLTTISTSAELNRRTPNTDLQLDYLGNYSRVNGEQTANNQRVNTAYDIRIDRNWFGRPLQIEYYEDQLANVALQITASPALGYYIYDRTGLTWLVSAGPGFQYKQFETVGLGEADSTATAAGIFYSKYKVDITSRLDFSVRYRAIFVSEEAGTYMHHTISTLSFEIKRYLNLDISYIWDYLQNPQRESNGTQPQKSDSYLTIGLGVRF